jgi:pimeloyl-ACP methyl ester carboxylesterase
VWNDRRIHFVDEGSGPALLCLHGLGGNADNRLHQCCFLERTHRVLSLDFPGHGWSEGRDVGFRSYWHVIEGLLEHVGLAPTVICALSSAGVALAARRPTRVDRIVVNAFMHLTPDDEAKRLALYDILAQKDGARSWAKQLLESMGVANRPAIVRGFLRSLDAIDPQHIRSIFRELIAYDQRPELKDVSCPTLLIRGEEDGFVPSYCVEELHYGLTNSQVVRLPACGRLPYLEDPTGFNILVSDFVA